MYTCHIIVLLLVFWFQTIRGSQNAVFDKNYSDRLTERNNQQSSLQQINTANHATVSSDPNHFTLQATEPSINSQTPHQISNLAANKQYENERFRRSSSVDSSSGSSSTETGPTLNSGILPGDSDNDAKIPINFLRLYFCGPGYQNCMHDERFNNIRVQSELLKQMPRLTDITLPTNYMDWKSKQMSLPRNIKDVTKVVGHRDHGFVADEPHYMLVRSGDDNQQMALLSEPELNDPFIPQRGRRQSNAQTYDDPFYPMRGRRAEAQAWDDPFFPMRGRRADSTWDDPFYPMRGRRADKIDNPWDDPFVPMRGRRRVSDDVKRSKSQPWDDPFVPMRGRRRPAKSNDIDDPFIPMRGRKGDYDDVFIPMRGRRSTKHTERRKRNLLASTGTFNEIYTPSEEVIVKLNGVHDSSKIVHSLPMQSLSNHLLNRFEQKTGPIQSVESTNSHSVLNAKHRQQQQQHQQQQHQKKSYYLLDDFATNPDDERDNGLMNDYATDYYVESPQMNKNKVHASTKQQQQRWMKSSKDLSQNRDAGNLARGSGTSLLF